MAAHAKKKVVKKTKPKKSRKAKRIGRALPAVDAAKAIADTVNAGSKAFDVFWKGEPLGIMKRPEFRAFGVTYKSPGLLGRIWQWIFGKKAVQTDVTNAATWESRPREYVRIGEKIYSVRADLWEQYDALNADHSALMRIAKRTGERADAVFDAMMREAKGGINGE